MTSFRIRFGGTGASAECTRNPLPTIDERTFTDGIRKSPPHGTAAACAGFLLSTPSSGVGGASYKIVWLPLEIWRYGLLSLISVGAFVREPENMPLLEQTLALHDTWTNPVDAYNQVREAAREKILRMLGKIDDVVLDRIL